VTTSSAKVYFHEIDGLRAIAVLAVLFFHVRLDGFSGGFVGVDIFFVISGFLITRNILHDMERGAFRVANFWIGRIIRLGPSLIFTVVLTLIAGIILLPPANLEQLAVSSASSVLSLSNIYFWLEVGYFDTSAETSPLLHTWSLGVEEQFYLLWSLLLVFLSAHKKHLLWLTLAALGIGSFIASQALIPEHESTAFYIMPMRIWQFSMGAFCVVMPSTAFKKMVNANAAILLGLVGIGWSVFSYSATTSFPGVAALLPTVGTVACILWLRGSYFLRMFDNPLSVWLGKISYSVYLVHWPLVVFWRLSNGGELDPLNKVMVSGLSIFLGWIIYQWIETPIRHTHRFLPAIKSMAVLVSALIVLASSIVIVQQEGFAGRLPEELRITAKELTQEKNRYWKERPHNGFASNDKHNIMVVGDSFGIDMFYAIWGQSGDDANLEYRHFPYTCRELRNDGELHKQPGSCGESFKQLLSDGVLARADFIVIAEQWERGIDFTTLANVLRSIADKTEATLIITGPKMTYQRIPHNVLIRSKDVLIGSLKVDEYQHVWRYEQNVRLAEFAHDQGYGYLELLSKQCHEQQCKVLTANNKLIYFDGDHWTREGSVFIREQLLQAKEPLWLKILSIN